MHRGVSRIVRYCFVQVVAWKGLKNPKLAHFNIHCNKSLDTSQYID